MASGSEPAIPIPVDSPADEWSDNEASSETSEISSEIITREEVSIMCISLCNHGYSKDYEWLVSSDFFCLKEFWFTISYSGAHRVRRTLLIYNILYIIYDETNE